jgi:hypothetical protein
MPINRLRAVAFGVSSILSIRYCLVVARDTLPSERAEHFSAKVGRADTDRFPAKVESFVMLFSLLLDCGVN